MNTNQLSKLLNYKEAADFLGIHQVTLRRWVSEKRVTCVKLAHTTVRFRLADLESMMQIQEATDAKI